MDFSRCRVAGTLDPPKLHSSRLNKSQRLAAVAVLLVDTDRASTPISESIYGQFLEHINHSVEDGLFAEQIRGAGFEGEDFKTYWKPLPEHGEVELASLHFTMAVVCAAPRRRRACRHSTGPRVPATGRQIRRLAVDEA